jgi:hypothetical protein
VIERRGGARFLLETLSAVSVRRKRCGQNFDGYIASQAGIAGAINFAHASRAD